MERDEDQIRWEKENKLHKKEISGYETQRKNLLTEINKIEVQKAIHLEKNESQTTLNLILFFFFFFFLYK